MEAVRKLRLELFLYILAPTAFGAALWGIIFGLFVILHGLPNALLLFRCSDTVSLAPFYPSITYAVSAYFSSRFWDLAFLPFWGLVAYSGMTSLKQDGKYKRTPAIAGAVAGLLVVLTALAGILFAPGRPFGFLASTCVVAIRVEFALVALLIIGVVRGRGWTLSLSLRTAAMFAATLMFPVLIADGWPSASFIGVAAFISLSLPVFLVWWIAGVIRLCFGQDDITPT